MPESYVGNEGTAAAADGMTVLDGTEDRRTGWLAINKTRDYIVSKCAAALTAAKAYTDQKVAAISLTWNAITDKPTEFPPSAHAHSAISGDGGAFLRWTGTQWLANALFGIGAPLEVASTATVGGALINPWARNNGVSGWSALGVNAAGQFGFQMSSRRFKKDIKSWTPDRQAILAMRLVEFRYKVAYDDGTGDIDHGLIAEELHDLGLEWLVAYDGDGLPVTVRYERIGLALLPIVQDHEARIAALEGR